MLPILFGIGILLSCWVVAHVLATTTRRLFSRINLDPILARLYGQEIPGEVSQRATRIVYFVSLLTAIGLSLSILVGIEPVGNALLSRIQDRVDGELIRGVLILVPDYLLLFMGLFLAFQFIAIINAIFPKLYRVIEQWRYSRFREVKIQNLELLNHDQLTGFLLLLAKYVRLGLILLLGSICLTLIFSFFPETEGLANGLASKIVAIFEGLWERFLSFLPNLLTLALIVVLTRYTLMVLHFFSEGFRKGELRHTRFHPELAEPTYQLVRFLVIALGLVAAFPYIPGSDSPVFRGISIFVGFLLSLGSTSLVTNVVSGVVLTYTRGLRIGDRVQIGEAVGDVIERTLLVTRIRTIKNVEITIPNGKVINNHIINYSISAKERGLILNTTVTIGYDVPWRLVHDLLITAALETTDILEFPEPFVLQTSLDDYYVSYELNAYTMAPSKMAMIYSLLHQNIQDKFNEAKVEILSPGYTAVRDGNQVSIPREYLPKDYSPPAFRTLPIGNGRLDR